MEIIQGLKPGVFLRHNTYRIEKVLGQGGFGITYLAMDLNLDRYVAIKEFFPKDYCDRDDATSHVTLGTQGSKEFVNRLKAKFLKEARNIARFDNPNIIRIHAAFEENDTAYYVMDYIEGLNLYEMVKRYGFLNEDKALEYVEKVGKALIYVHGKRMNHLDVKPANILIRKSDDTPILIDFGLSKQYDSEGNQTSTTPTGISHGYAPPEQYNDGGVKEFSPQTDIYSLAATLYYALSGVVPPQATSLIEEDLTFPEAIPTRFIGPVSKAMSPGRKDRQKTIEAFLNELDISMTESAATSIVKIIENHKPEPKISNDHEKHEYPKPMDNYEPKISQWIWIAAVGVIAVVLGIIWYNNAKITETNASEIEVPLTVTDLFWESPLGGATYTGEVVPETLPNGEIKMIPNGKGIAKIIIGEYTGSEYDGQFVNGIMEGETKYRLKDGDIYEGTFKANKYERGRYTLKESGEYFEGSFKNMEPYRGQWYSADGKVIENI